MKSGATVRNQTESSVIRRDRKKSGAEVRVTLQTVY